MERAELTLHVRLVREVAKRLLAEVDKFETLLGQLRDVLQQQPDVTTNVVPSTEHQSNRILRIADVVRSVGLGRSTIYKLQQQAGSRRNFAYQPDRSGGAQTTSRLGSNRRRKALSRNER